LQKPGVHYNLDQTEDNLHRDESAFTRVSNSVALWVNLPKLAPILLWQAISRSHSALTRVV